MIERTIGNETALGEADSNGAVCNHGIIVEFTAVSFDAGWNVDCEDEGVRVMPQLIDFTAGSTDRLAQRRRRAEPEQTVKQHEAAVRLPRGRRDGIEFFSH